MVQVVTVKLSEILAFKTFEIGQFSFAPAAAISIFDLSAPVALTVVCNLLSVIPKPGPCFSKITTAVVSIRSAVIPTLPNSADSAIEKQLECAAAISSSGFKPFAPSKRVAKVYGVSFNTPLPTETVPRPSLRPPVHFAVALFSIFIPEHYIFAFTFDLIRIIANRRSTLGDYEKNMGSAIRRNERIARLERLGRLLDSSIPIGRGGTRIGWDPLIGLIPGIGDFLTTAIGGYLIFESARIGISRITLARMMVNLGIDALIGAIPLVGDLFDFGFKANARNLTLLKEAKFSDRDMSIGNRLVGAGLIVWMCLITLSAAAAYLLLVSLQALFG